MHHTEPVKTICKFIICDFGKSQIPIFFRRNKTKYLFTVLNFSKTNCRFIRYHFEKDKIRIFNRTIETEHLIRHIGSAL